MKVRMAERIKIERYILKGRERERETGHHFILFFSKSILFFISLFEYYFRRGRRREGKSF